MFQGYIKSRIKFLLAYALFALVFCLVSWIYELPADALIYTLILCSFFGVIFLTSGYLRYVQKVTLLRDNKAKALHDISEMPQPFDGAEDEYRQIIDILAGRIADGISQRDKAFTDMIDYYTMWAHQIKTPIAAMRLMLQSDGEEGKSQLETELLKIEQYVEMVLHYLRLGSDSTDFIIREQDLDAIIKESVKKYSTVFIKKKISLNYEQTGYRPITDEKWLSFVIEQILSNSLKYTASGSISIYMDPEQEGVLVIEDTGIGIQPEDLPRVFDKGYTGYNGRKDKKSTGIGLYICRRIMDKLMHGITISSQTGRGTIVKLDISYKSVRFE